MFRYCYCALLFCSRGPEGPGRVHGGLYRAIVYVSGFSLHVEATVGVLRPIVRSLVCLVPIDWDIWPSVLFLRLPVQWSCLRQEYTAARQESEWERNFEYTLVLVYLGVIRWLPLLCSVVSVAVLPVCVVVSTCLSRSFSRELTAGSKPKLVSVQYGINVVI